MLRFSMCRFDNLEEIKWGFLKELKIGHSCLASGNFRVIKKIVLCCPVLEVLELNNCCGFKYLNFDKHAKLKRLVVNNIWDKVEETGQTLISILAPTVRVLELLGDFCLKRVKIQRMNSCVEAKLDYRMSLGEHHCSITNLLRNLNSLKHVHTLICGTWIIEIVSWNSRNGFPLDHQLRECKYLTLHSPLLLPYQLGILHLLQSCPNTEELIISAARSSPLSEEQDPDEEIQDYDAPVQELEAMQKEREDEADRLSTLPDEILIEILTLLPFKEIFRTSTLSRSWRNLDIPTNIPLLNFRHRSTTARVQQFFHTIEVSLGGRYYGIAGFCIDFRFRCRFQEDVVSLILQAVTCKVKNLNLILSNGNPNWALTNDIIGRRIHFFLLPAFLYENQFLEMLSFSMYSFHGIQEIKWGFLKDLKIGNTSLRSGNTSVIEKIVLGCPVLEVLRVEQLLGI